MEGLYKPLAGLSPNQLELLQLRIARLKKSNGESSPAPITLQKRDSTTAPLSFAQQRIWFANRVSPESAAYNVVQGVRLTGRLDVAALEQSLTEVARRHEALRTAFGMVEGQPVQVISEGLSLSVEQVDLASFSEAEMESRVRDLAAEDARRPFDLSRPPLMRIILLCVGDSRFVMLLTMHHIISDFWSLGVLIREMASLYEAYSKGSPSTLDELPVQYRDYACWQREWLQGQVLETQLSYWKRRLGGDLPALDLPADRPRASIQDLTGAIRTLDLSESLSESLRSLSRLQGCTLTMTLLAAFKVLLHRLTGQDDIILGLTIANRNRPEIERLIGFFVNTLALRTDVSGNPAFSNLLHRVREACLEAYGHQDLPFDKLVGELRPERKLNRHPIFDILFNSLNAPLKRVELPGLIVKDFERDDPESKFALTFNVEEFGRQIGLRVVYQRALFSSERIVCLLNQYRHLLEQVVANPQSPILSYSLVTPEDGFVLPDPRASIPEPRYEPITKLFAREAERAPQQPAISQGDRVWSYAELAEAVSSLTGAIRSRGVERGDVVAVTGRRSFGLMASMMAALFSGGVILPVDPRLPMRRKQIMLSESRARWALCVDSPPGEEWAQEEPLATIAVGAKTGLALETTEGKSFDAGPLPELSPDDPAYIFFTSGTTGVPKAVLGCHKGLSHFLSWQREEFSVGAGDRCAQLTNLSFDVVLRDIFLPLTSGATLCLPEDDEHPGPEKQLRWFEREHISLLHTVPSLAQMWLGSVPAGLSLGALRWVFFAGEPLTETLVRRWRETFPEAGGIVNLYGPTETTLAKCFYRVGANVVAGIQPLGGPIPQTQALVLNRGLRSCGIGEPGQIVVRTPYRSLGYLNAPDENQKRFIVNPYSDDERDLLYLTGDLGRYRTDGAVEILGRLDHQIKIRGVRVEPDEVTAVLSRHPAVSSCLVVGGEDERGEKILVAYAVASVRQEVRAADLRSYLSERLSAPMVPSVYVFLDRLPLKANGKVDRQALPHPPPAHSEMARTFVAARTPVEEELAKLWAEVLGLERVGVEDNLFDLGGHSLLATQILSRVRDAFQIEVPLQKLFERPTVAALAESLESIRRSGHGPQAPPAQPGTLKETLQRSVLSNLDRLTDTEVEALLDELLSR